MAVVMASGVIPIGAKTYWEVEEQSAKEDGFQQNQARGTNALRTKNTREHISKGARVRRSPQIQHLSSFYAQPPTD